MIFQMPQDFFDPRRSLADGIMENLRNHGSSKAEAKKRLQELLAMVELEPELAGRYPHQVSGGQCQRARLSQEPWLSSPPFSSVTRPPVLWM